MSYRSRVCYSPAIRYMIPVSRVLFSFTLMPRSWYKGIFYSPRAITGECYSLRAITGKYYQSSVAFGRKEEKMYTLCSGGVAVQGEATRYKLTVARSEWAWKFDASCNKGGVSSHFRFGGALLGRGHGRDLDRYFSDLLLLSTMPMFTLQSSSPSWCTIIIIQ